MKCHPASGRRLTERLQPPRTAAFFPSKLRYHGVAVRAAEPRDVGRTEARVPSHSSRDRQYLGRLLIGASATSSISSSNSR